MRNKKGQFVKTTGAERYKRKGYKGGAIQLSRWLWLQRYGEIPDDCIIHHKNGDKKDNRFENLQCMTWKEHNKLHCTGHTPWNKGITRKNKKWNETIKKALKIRKENYLKKCLEAYELKKEGLDNISIGLVLGITGRQVYDRLRDWRQDGKQEK